MIDLVRPSKGHITQPFGNIQPNGEPHTGDDFAYTNGAEIFPDVYAAHDGVVECVGDSRALGWPNMYYLNPDFDRSDSWDSSAGNIVVILHEATGTKTTYNHLESWDVKPGQHVVAGQRIGTCGNTGNSYGKHLHFEVLETPYNFNTPTYGRSQPVYTEQDDDMSAISQEWADNVIGAIARLDAKINPSPDARHFASQGDIDVVLSRLGQIEKQLGIGTAVKLVKGDKSSTVYVWDGSTGYRPIDYDEFVSLVATGAQLTMIDQKRLDAAIS